MQDLNKYTLEEIALGVEFELTPDGLALPEKGKHYPISHISTIDLFIGSGSKVSSRAVILSVAGIILLLVQTWWSILLGLASFYFAYNFFRKGPSLKIYRAIVWTNGDASDEGAPFHVEEKEREQFERVIARFPSIALNHK